MVQHEDLLTIVMIDDDNGDDNGDDDNGDNDNGDDDNGDGNGDDDNEYLLMILLDLSRDH